MGIHAGHAPPAGHFYLENLRCVASPLETIDATHNTLAAVFAPAWPAWPA